MTVDVDTIYHGFDRVLPYLTGETATRPTLYQGTGDCSAPNSTPSTTSAPLCSRGSVRGS